MDGRSGIEKGWERRDWYSDMVISDVRIKVSISCLGVEVNDSAGKVGRLNV